MTRKDYELIARTIRQQESEVTSGTGLAELSILVSNLSRVFMADNPRFDPDKFTRACGF